MLIVSAICFVALIILAIIGESILPIYGGDEELAARGSKASFALLAGIAFAFAQPAIWTFFGRMLQRTIAQGGATPLWAATLERPALISHLRTGGMALCAIFAVATVFGALQFWRGHW